MSGHSKWSSIKHQKGVADAKRGQVFTKLTREIIVAVREGGSSQESNFRLRLAVQKAREANMPMENIDRAIKRGSGELGGAAPVDMVLEGYGPSGAAIMVQAQSDNRNRTLQEIRNTFNRGGGSLAEAGSVSWIFDPKGIIVVETKDVDADEVSLKAIDAGAEDVQPMDGFIEIYTKPDHFELVRTMLQQNKIPIASSEISMVPKTSVELDEKASLQTLKMVRKLEELDDTTGVFTNVDFTDEVLQKYDELGE